MFDTLVIGADVIDGTGAPPRRATIGIVRDRMIELGVHERPRAIETVWAEGCIVTPGLIDPHSHSDWSLLGNRDALSTIHQGVTTEIVGNCGVTYAPIADPDRGETEAALRAFGYDGEVSWRTFGEYLDVVHGGGTAQNLLWFAGHTALRRAASRDSDAYGIDTGRALEWRLREALDAGAVGLSTGLEYGDGRFASREELRDLGRVLGERGAFYASHIRNRDSALGAAVDEFFDVVHAAQVPAQLSHLNVRHNTGAAADAWARAVDRLELERARGVDVLADMTPYPEGIGMAVGLLPEWLLVDGFAAAAAALADGAVRHRVRVDSDRYWRFIHRGEWHRVRVGVASATPQWEGQSLPQIARQTGSDEWDALFDILEAAGGEMGSVQLLGELFRPEHVAEAVAHESFLLGVDGFTSRADGPLAARTRHPLFFYGHTHYLAYHALRAGTLSVEEAVRKMTGAVADHFRLVDRGVVRTGAYADLVVFDPGVLERTDTFALPDQYSAAARYVWVNGLPAISDGVRTDRRGGRRLISRR